MPTAEQHHGIGGRGQHAPAEQRHGDHEGVQGVMRRHRGELHRLGQVGRQRRRTVTQAHSQADQRERQDGDAERLMDCNERQIFRHDRGHHAHADKQHGQDAGRHEPVQQTLQRGEASATPDHRVAPVAVRG